MLGSRSAQVKNTKGRWNNSNYSTSQFRQSPMDLRSQISSGWEQCRGIQILTRCHGSLEKSHGYRKNTSCGHTFCPLPSVVTKATLPPDRNNFNGKTMSSNPKTIFTKWTPSYGSQPKPTPCSSPWPTDIPRT